MAWIERKKRGDGGTSAGVRWRLGGTRTGPVQSETFSAGTDVQNLARAEGFKRMVEAAGHEWPDGWVKGMGFVRPRGDSDPMKPPPELAELGEEYVRQIVDLSSGQRKRHIDLSRSPNGSGRRGLERSADCFLGDVWSLTVRAERIRPAPVR
jgi:hypothetical protein